MPEQNQPTQPHIENPVLVDAMAIFKTDLTNHVNERAFLEAAISAKYLVPAKVEPSDEPAPEGEQPRARIAFQVMTNPQNQKFMPVFTDEIELRKNRKPGESFQVAVMGFPDIYNFVKSAEEISGVVINPFGSNLCLVRPQIILIGDNGGDLDAIAAKAKPVSPSNPLGAASNSREQQQAAIRQAMADIEAQKSNETTDAPDDTVAVTDELLSALKSCLKKQKAVKKAYIKPETDGDERFLLIALEADDSADITEIGNTVSTDCADYSDLAFECVAASSIRAKELIANEKPFYEKKRFGIF